MTLPDYNFHNVVNNELRPRGGAAAEKTNGAAKDAADGQFVRGIDPRTEEELWPCPVATAQDLNDAIVAANAAFPAWAQTTVAQRQALLVRMADQIKANEVELMDILRRETGKSAIVAGIEIANTIEQIMYYSTISVEDEVQFENDDIRIVATHPPLGVVGAICPWNFPLILCNFKVISALLTGNCVIVKPSPFTPYGVLRWIELTTQLFPPGVVQAVNGDADLGVLMTQHPGIHKISFTGTTATGRRVMASCAQTLKKVTLELAGNDAAIVFPDVVESDERFNTVVATTVGGAFFNAGQMCVATKRIYVHESIYDRFLAKFIEETNNGYAPAVAAAGDDAVPTVFGPVSNRLQYDTVLKFLADTKQHAPGHIVAGGNVREGKGFWIEPTVVADPPEDSLLVQEEQFGPIIPILKWSTEDDVVARANLANAGLGATVYSADLARARSMANRLEAGSVWINAAGQPNPRAYFSGFKESGFGGEMGKQGLMSYVNTKCIHIPKDKTTAAAAEGEGSASSNPLAAIFSCFK